MGKLIKILTFFFVVVALLLCLYSCKHNKTLEKTSEKTKDSISVVTNTIIKDSLIYTDVDSASIKALVKCPDVKPIVVKNKIARATFEIKNGVAKADCFCDSTGIISRTTNTIKTVFKQHLNDAVKITTVQVPYLPLWAKILSIIGGIALLFGTFKLLNFIKII